MNSPDPLFQSYSNTIRDNERALTASTLGVSSQYPSVRWNGKNLGPWCIVCLSTPGSRPGGLMNFQCSTRARDQCAYTAAMYHVPSQGYTVSCRRGGGLSQLELPMGLWNSATFFGSQENAARSMWIFRIPVSTWRGNTS